MKNSLTKKWISFALAILFVLPLMQPLRADAEENIDLENFAGLCLTAPSDATVVLYEGLAARNTTFPVVSPSATETVGGTTYYYFPNLQGNYHYKVTCSGYYTVYKDIYMSPEKAATAGSLPPTTPTPMRCWSPLWHPILPCGRSTPLRWISPACKRIILPIR